MNLSKKKQLSIVFGILLVLNFYFLLVIHEINQPQLMEVIFFDVGQGDAVLIKSPENHYIIIDGGPDSKLVEKISKEIPFYRKDIDLVVLTHPHQDHLSGLIDLLEKYNVKNILYTGVYADTIEYSKWEKLIQEKEIFIASAGQRIKGKDFYIDVLYPIDSMENKKIKDLNDSSIVLRLVYNEDSFIFMGDLYSRGEKDLIKLMNSCLASQDFSYICRAMVLKSKILKVGHHGSKTSTSEDFVSIVDPSIAVISVGENNKYNHPHSETLEALKKYDIRVLRTDTDGDIKIFSSGKSLK